jgi:hypothetical protein
MNHVLAHLVLALAAAQLLHGFSEVFSARMKVARLSAYIQGRPWKEMRLNIDTRPKAYAFALTVFVILTAVFFGVFTAINATGNTLLLIAGALVLITYWGELIGFDHFHTDIEAVTRPFKARRGQSS